MKRIGIASQTVFGMPPVEVVQLAADLGCGHISSGLMPVPWKLDRFPSWSLRTDRGLRSAFREALRDTGIRFELAEGCVLRPGTSAADYAEDLDILVDLGARAIGTVTLDHDAPRTAAELAALARMARERGLGLLVEFAPPHLLDTLGEAVAAIAAIDVPGVRLTIDAMHFFRSGGTSAELAAIDPGLIGYAQLCDAPATSGLDYYQEASFNRLMPGDGELPLTDLVAVLPPEVPVGLELPMRARIDRGERLEDLIAEAVARSAPYLQAA